MVLFFKHIPFMVNHTNNATPPERLQHYLSSLNLLKEKAIRSSFPLDMTNDMIAMASNWEKVYWPQKAKRKMTLKFGLHLFPT